MSSSVSNIGINIGGGATSPVSFSTLRDTFFRETPTSATPTGSISASQLLRTTDLPSSGTQSNPRVPDATENSNIVTSQSNWKVSHFQQSVKFYIIVQSDTDTDYNINSQSWNSNLEKNIVKRMRITGTTGATSISNYAASFNASAYNLIIEISGNVYGAGGRGGGTGSGAPAISGQNGGPALYVSSSTGQVIIDIASSGNVYAGGGGGEKGNTGADGTGGSCYVDSVQYNCGGCPGCPSGYTSLGCEGNWHCGRKMEDAGWGGHYWASTGNSFKTTCRATTTTSGGLGGAGGNGGPGRGYNNLSGSRIGATGSDGTAGGTCPSDYTTETDATAGLKGETGGTGGDWGNPGGDTLNTGSGGRAGTSISGSNYTTRGSTGSSNVK